MSETKRKHRATGRPRGGARYRVLGDGQVAAYTALRDACDKLGIDHPAVKRAIGELQKVQRGDPGYNGRYVGVKLQALVLELRLYLSEAPKRLEVSGQLRLEQLVPPLDADAD